MSWPLMLAMLSTTLMIFVDRLFLARFDPTALNAAATGGMAYYIFLVLPLSIAAISEVIVGRLHGEKRYAEVGSAAWQMIWFSWSLIPLFLAVSYFGPSLIFKGSGIEPLETAYFSTLLYFAPFQCAVVALSGFFIGVGKVKVVTIAAIIGNAMNIALDYLLIFGYGPVPCMGISGAAYATGLSEVMQVLFLLTLFLKKSEKATYQTSRLKFQPHFFKESLKIGTPSGLGHTLEVVAHFIFFRLIMSVGQAQMTIVALVQTFYILSTFIIEAGSKAISAIVANLLGADKHPAIKKVLRSAFTLHTIYFCLFTGVVLLFPDALIRLFFSDTHSFLFTNPAMKQMFIHALCSMTLFFLFDGFSWLLVGCLTAAGDTRFIFWTSLVVYCFAYVLPAILFIGLEHKGADLAWMIIAGMGLINLIIYAYRYLTGQWLKNYRRL